jgi:hypothetical protein
MFLSCRVKILVGSTDFDFPIFRRFECSTGVVDIEGSESRRSSVDDEALISLLFLFIFLGGGMGAAGSGGGIGGDGETDREEFILNDPVLWPLSFSVSSFSRSVLLLAGFRSGDVDADDEDFLPKPNFFSVLLRLDLSMVIWWGWKSLFIFIGS